MTIFVFLRHAQSIANDRGVLAGRHEGITLSKRGRAQARRIAKIYSDYGFDLIYSSPLQRCIETVDGLARVTRKKVISDSAFVEMNYGDWSGKFLSELSKKREWKLIQSKPSGFKFPKGESFTGAQRRVIKRLNELSVKHPNKTILIVTHGDIIKLAVQSVMNGALDDFQRIVVDPASITVCHWSKKEKSLLHLNLPSGNSIADSIHRFSVKARSRRKVLGGGSGV